MKRLLFLLPLLFFSVQIFAQTTVTLVIKRPEVAFTHASVNTADSLHLNTGVTFGFTSDTTLTIGAQDTIIVLDDGVVRFKILVADIPNDNEVITFDAASLVASWEPPPGAGGGEANTASNLGGGLANFDTKSGVDLRFNSFLATDFNLAANQLSIDPATAKIWTAIHSFSDNNFQINNPANTFQYIFGTSALVADRIVELPLLTGTDTFTFNAFSATFTNKTIAAGSNTITGIVDANIDAHTTTKITTTAKGQLNSAIVYNDQANTFGAFAQRFDDDNFQLDNPANTFQYIFNTNAIVADRIVTLPLLTGGDIFTFNAFAATLTNKTIAAGSNTITGIGSAEISDNSVTRDDVEAELRTEVMTWTFEDPVAADAFSGHKLPFPVTFIEIACHTDVGTADINVEERAEVTPNTFGTDALAADLQCTTTQAEQTSFSNAGFSVNTWPYLTVSAVASSPTLVTITVRYTID